MKQNPNYKILDEYHDQEQINDALTRGFNIAGAFIAPRGFGPVLETFLVMQRPPVHISRIHRKKK